MKYAMLLLGGALRFLHRAFEFLMDFVEVSLGGLNVKVLVNF